MQETDQSYGLFKSKFAKNLKALSDAQINGDFPTSFPQWMVGLLVFGGTLWQDIKASLRGRWGILSRT